MTQNYHEKLFSELGIGNYSFSSANDVTMGGSGNAQTDDGGSGNTQTNGGGSGNAQTNGGGSATVIQEGSAISGITAGMQEVIDNDLFISPGDAIISDYFNQMQSSQPYSSVTLANIVNPEETIFPAPETPLFKVPVNPLLPKEYQEILSYEAVQYINGFLRTQIGKYIMVEQIIGTSEKQDVYGHLIGVGINYILVQGENKEVTLIDIYTVKNVTFFFGMTAAE